MDDSHNQLVEDLSRQVKDFHESKTAFLVYHGSTNSTRSLSFKRDQMLDVSQLNRVLSIDPKKRIAIVEPNVAMDILLDQTLEHGLMPPVVMEFPGITVGGGIQGGAGESSSFKWGCFNRLSNWHEMILADGSTIKTSPKDNADLFNGTAGSYGSLGVLTASEIKLIPAKKYVRLDYIKVGSYTQAVTKIDEIVSNGKYDYIDGIMFSPNSGTILAGSLCDEAVVPIQRFSRSHDPWFYLHVENMSQKHEIWSETVPLKDYLFRYDRGAFWTGRYPFERAGIPFNRFTRWMLDPLLHTRKLYQALQASGAAQQYIVQDMAVSSDKTVEFIEYLAKQLNTFPLWLCPMLPDRDSPLLCNNIDCKQVINVGIWAGTKFANHKAFVEANRMIETELHRLGGKKWFYAHSYYTETEFWKIYDKQWYINLRKKYKADSLPTIYDKIRVKDQPPVNIRKAALKTIFGLSKLTIK